MTLNLSALREQIAQQVNTIEVEIAAGTVTLSRLPAAAAIMFARVMGSIPDTHKDEHGHITAPESLVAVQVEMVALSLVNADGVREFDSAEGRALIAQLPSFDLMKLFNEANQLNDLATVVSNAKKN